MLSIEDQAKVTELISTVGIAPALVMKLEEMNGLLGNVIQQQRNIVEFLGRRVAPEKAMEAMTGELRAIRILMDEKGKFAFMDQPRESIPNDTKKKSKK